MNGEAVLDLHPASGFGTVREVFDAIRKSDLEFDQLIVEFGRWVHMGFGYKTAARCWPTTATDTGRLFDGA